MEISHMKISIQ